MRHTGSTVPTDDAARLLAHLDGVGVNLRDLDPDAPDPDHVPERKIGDRRWLVAAAKRRRFLEVFAVRRDKAEAMEAVGWTEAQYRYAIKRDRRFAHEVFRIRGSRTGRPSKATVMAQLIEDRERALAMAAEGKPPPDIPELPPADGEDGPLSWHGFGGFRKVFFGMDTHWFQRQIVDILEASDPGTVTLVLLPPEHGKTSLLEDWLGYKLAVEPEFRCVYASEKQAHARKVIKRIKNRMHPDGPCSAYVERFGPFVPQTGEDAHPQPWSQDYFDVWRRSASDERDYNMVGLGFGSAVAGTRCDLLVLDDVQSLKSLNWTDKLVDEFRQDWLSRPGSRGRTVILGTRVGEGDFYERIMELELVDHLVKYPAIDGEGRYLWPERYSVKDYERMRRNVGESAWARNYQQQPAAAGDRTFAQAELDGASDPLLRHARRPEHLTIRSCIVGHDPGFGTNAVFVAGVTDDRFVALDWRVDKGLTSTAQMAQVIDDTMAHWLGQGVRPAHLVVEDKYVGQGFFADEAFLDLTRKYGCSMSGHRTGYSKYDDDLGVAAMARSFRVGEIVLPGADDPDTLRARAALDAELAAWRPNVKGTKLRQDLVMAMWFPLDVRTPVWTPDGFRTVGTLQLGDRVAAPDGSIVRVMGRTPTERKPVWKVTLSDGSSLRATLDHGWWVEPLEKGGARAPGQWMTTAELVTRRGDFKRLRLRRPEVIDSPDADLPLDPYVLGVWLGDGDARQATIFQAPSDIDDLTLQLELAGVQTRRHSHPYRFGILGVRSALAELGVLGNKHVPAPYMYASAKQRLALLQGLMDTDGTVHNIGRAGGRCMFGNTNKALVDAVEMLALSLGFRPNVQAQPAGTTRTPQGESDTQPFWRVLFTAHSGMPNPFRLRRKAERAERDALRVLTHLTIVSVEPDGEADVACITVDHPAHQFLAGPRLVPTGNCWMRWRTERMVATTDDRTNLIRLQGLGAMRPVPFRPVVSAKGALVLGGKR